MTTALAAIILLGLLVFVHELGHFLLARRYGIGVEKFSLGFGPKLFGRKRGDTEYLISAIPLGGYVKLMGEDPKDTEVDPKKSFALRPVRERLVVVLAGPAFNVFFAVLVFWVIYMAGVPVLRATVGEVIPESPAALAGFQPNDRIVTIDEQPIEEWDQLVSLVGVSEGRPLQMTVLRGGETVELQVTPALRKAQNLFNEEIERPMIGIQNLGTDFFLRRVDPLTALGRGFTQSGNIVSLTAVSVWKIVRGDLPARESLGGPILIVQMAGQQFRRGVMNYAFFAALISLNLAILNLLPIPVLDGGHIFFFLLEAGIGRPVSLRKREIAQQVGLFLIILLMVFAFYNDVARIFSPAGGTP